MTDRFATARLVADAVLYEGYLLYPYRASSTKNKVRWQFGVLVPPAFAAADPSERCRLRAEVIIAPGTQPVLHARVRFLQLEERTRPDAADGLEPWDEAREHSVDIAPMPLPLDGAARSTTFTVAGGSERTGGPEGPVMRQRQALRGTVLIDARRATERDALVKLTVTVVNDTGWVPPGARADALRCSLVGVHLLLALDDGAFVSSIDPPADARDAVAGCVNDGTFPVLVGDGHGGDVVLCAPIILYDHPAVAPESLGDMYDATEIDEILALRVLTLTDEEKAEARRGDARAAAIIDRCDDMPPELWTRLHGAVRSLHPVVPDEPDEPLPWWEPAVDSSCNPASDTLTLQGTEVRAGSAVTLRPSRRADAHDMLLAGMRATVRGVYTDVDGEMLVAVTVDDDPATEAMVCQGRSLFFHPDEIEVASR